MGEMHFPDVGRMSVTVELDDNILKQVHRLCDDVLEAELLLDFRFDFIEGI